MHRVCRAATLFFWKRFEWTFAMHMRGVRPLARSSSRVAWMEEKLVVSESEGEMNLGEGSRLGEWLGGVVGESDGESDSKSA